MKTRVLSIINVALLAFIVVLSVPAEVSATPGDGATQDVLYMSDGRILTGNILDENDAEVEFEYIDRNLNISTTLNIKKSEIADIKRDVPFKGGDDAKDDNSDSGFASNGSLAAAAEPDDDYFGSSLGDEWYGVSRMASDDERVPAFYIIPMKGQMGTDVNTAAYEEVVEDIKRVDPDVLLIVMDSYDNEPVTNFIDASAFERPEEGIVDFDDYRKLVSMFHDELPKVRQVLWVHDAVGVSSAVALAWKEMYMKPDAKFGGMTIIRDRYGFDTYTDENVKGKMREATIAMTKSFLEYGGYPLVLVDAMVRPEMMLSGSFKGREVEWQLDTEGDYVVDASDKATLNLDAKHAEDLCVSSGTAETLDDLALLLGYREYRLTGGRGADDVSKYIDNWRRSYDRCVEWLQDYQQFMGWATGDETRKYLGRCKTSLERILAAMDRYKAVETRMGTDFGLSRAALVTTIEQLKERLRSLNENGGRGGGGTGSGGFGRGGGGRR